MTELLPLGLVLAGMVASIALLLLASPQTISYNVDGVQRQAIVVAPSRATAHPPLVFVFHGHGGNMNHSLRTFNVNSLWPEAVVVYPQGLPTKGITDPQGTKNGWQQRPGTDGDRDIKFFDAMYKDLTAHYRVDRKHVYSMGHSNGARFSVVLWSTRGDLLSAVGVSSSMTMPMSLSPKPVFFVAGEKDPIVPYRSMTRSIDQAIQRNGLSKPGTKLSDYLTLYSGSMPVETYIHPGSHNFPKEAGTAMVDFLRSH